MDRRSGWTTPPFATKYRYLPLVQERSIRLLYLQPGSFGTDISCCLQIVDVDDDALEYHALSYTWGDPAREHFIEIQDLDVTSEKEQMEPSIESYVSKPRSDSMLAPERIQQAAVLDLATHQKSYTVLGITSSLHEALQHLRSPNAVVILWVDALCIDQDNLSERSLQIQHMPAIYSNAQKVIIWLGPADEYSNMAFDWLTTTWFQLLHDDDEAERQGRKDDSGWRGKIKVTEEQVSALRNTFSSRGSRLWWERRWVIQELAFSKQAEFHCGVRIVDQVALYTLAALCFSGGLDAEDRQIRSMQIQIALAGVSDMFDIKAVTATGPTLGQLLPATRSFKATDPRDNVYALMSLCGASPATLVPDYTKSVCDIYNEVTRTLLHETGDLSSLCRSRVTTCENEETQRWAAAEPAIPFWLPDLADGLRRNQTLEYQHYNASLHHALDVALLDTPDPGILRLKCVNCDAVGVVATTPDFAYFLADGTFSDWWKENASIMPYQTIMYIRHKLQTTLLAKGHCPSSKELADAASALEYLEAYTDEVDDDSLRVTKVAKVLRHITRLSTIPGDDDYRFRERCIDLLAILQDRSLDQSDQRPSEMDLFLRALRMDLACDPIESEESGRMSSEVLSTYKHVFHKYIRPGILQENVSRWFAQPEEIQQATAFERDLLWRGRDFYGSVDNHFRDGWSFCRMQSGCYGWVPEHAQAGDMVFVVYGSPVPFLLREMAADEQEHERGLSDGRHYTMVGTCYVQGVMDGEAVADDHECETIYLH